MDMLPLKPERKAQLEEYARRCGADPAVALDDALAAYLEWEGQDFAEAVEGIRQGHEDVKAGHTRPAAEFLADMRRKHIPAVRAAAVTLWLVSQVTRYGMDVADRGKWSWLQPPIGDCD